jgi:hypothetical protein
MSRFGSGSSKDAFAVLGDAIAASTDAMKKTASNARHGTSQAVPAVRSTLGKALYVAAYYASYSAVFAALAVGRLAPPIDAWADGVHDGAAAARDIGRNGAMRARSAARGRVPVRRSASVRRHHG